MTVEEILEKAKNEEELTETDALTLLAIPTQTPEYEALLQAAADLSRKTYGAKGYIFVQIGLNAAPCSGNCTFCSLAQCNSTITEESEKSEEELLEEIRRIDFSSVSSVFLMTTADYDPEQFLDLGAKVHAILPEQTALVANTGDFDLDYALRMKQVGFTGAYHIVRLREGVDTALAPELRIRTLDAIADAGLRLYYCIEPIGPEHTYEEIVTEMMRARDRHVDVMAVMRRVSVPRTGCADAAMVSDFEMAKIAAVTRLVTRPGISMNVHEPICEAMRAGVNQLYAEIGVNPRDTSTQTEKSRGFDVKKASDMLRSAGFLPCPNGK